MFSPVTKPNTRQFARTEARRKTADGGVLVSRTPPPRLPNSVTPSSRPDRAPADVGDRRDHGDSPETSPVRSPAAPRWRRRSSTPPPTAGQPDGSRQVVPEVGSGDTEGGSTSEGGEKFRGLGGSFWYRHKAKLNKISGIWEPFQKRGFMTRVYHYKWRAPGV